MRNFLIATTGFLLGGGLVVGLILTVTQTTTVTGTRMAMPRMRLVVTVA